MSTAPRPYSTPSAISPANGGCVHFASSPGGTTSVWPANTRCGRGGADAGVEILDRRGAGLARRSCDATVEARGLRARASIKRERAAFRRRHRRAAQQIAGEGDGIGARRFIGLLALRAELRGEQVVLISYPAGDQECIDQDPNDRDHRPDDGERQNQLRDSRRRCV